MNNILIPISYFIIASIIQTIFILNQSAKYRSFKKALPSVIIACICYCTLIYITVFNHELFIVFMLWFVVIPFFIIGFIFFIYMGYNMWNQSYYLTAEPESNSIQKQILAAVSISILSVLNPYILNMVNISLYNYQGNDIIAICIFVCMWFSLFAVIGYNIRKLEKDAIILKIINKIGAVIVWAIALQYLPTTIFTVKSFTTWIFIKHI